MVAAVLGTAALGLAAPPARAHEISTSVLDVRADGGAIDVSLGVHAHLVDLAVDADRDDDGTLTAPELDAAKDTFARYLLAHLAVRDGVAGVGAAAGALCPGALTALEPTRRGGAQASVRFACAGAAFTLDNRLFYALAPTHTFIGTMRVGGAAYQVRLDAQHTTLASAGAADALPEASVGSLIGEYLVLGVEHILGGIDHLLFVLTLVIVARRLRDLAWLITSFTLAHSITLTLAALDVVTLPSSFVEPAIAVTILAVAIVNIVTRGAKAHRPWLVFAFGLLHGFGFAGALAETGLPTHDVPWALGAFNVGVELGQLGVVIVSWPLVMWLSRARIDWYRVLVPTASALVALMSVVWFFERLP